MGSVFSFNDWSLTRFEDDSRRIDNEQENDSSGATAASDGECLYAQRRRSCGGPGMNEMRSSLESELADWRTGELANWRTGGLANERAGERGSWRATWSKSSGANEYQTFSGVRVKG